MFKLEASVTIKDVRIRLFMTITHIGKSHVVAHDLCDANSAIFCLRQKLW